MTSEGERLYRKRASQWHDFGGLKRGNCMATDIDGLIELDDKGYMFIEMKYGKKELSMGQRIALERLVYDTSIVNKFTLAVVAEHDVEDTDEIVDVASCRVREIYTCTTQRWQEINYTITVSKLLDRFYERVRQCH